MSTNESVDPFAKPAFEKIAFDKWGAFMYPDKIRPGWEHERSDSGSNAFEMYRAWCAGRAWALKPGLGTGEWLEDSGGVRNLLWRFMETFREEVVNVMSHIQAAKERGENSICLTGPFWMTEHPNAELGMLRLQIFELLRGLGYKAGVSFDDGAGGRDAVSGVGISWDVKND